MALVTTIVTILGTKFELGAAFPRINSYYGFCIAPFCRPSHNNFHNTPYTYFLKMLW